LKIALGTAQFGFDYGIANSCGQVSGSEAKAILEFARANGMDTLDTAIAYGESERLLGELSLDDWQVVSKLPAPPEGCVDISSWVRDSVYASLERLKMPRIYGLLLHQPQQLIGPAGDRLYQALQHLRAEGLVTKIGISIYAPDELEVLLARYKFDIVQAPFNLIDRRLIDSGWLFRLSEQQIELHVRSVFLQGLLLMKSEDRPKKFDRWALFWSKWDAWLVEVEATPLQACLRYALSFSNIGRVIVGVDSLEQLKEILQATAGPLPDIPEELQAHDLDLLNPARWSVL
jgi:aryl-alcohol dehydrogenase-like predicted oxidoreductase